MIWIRWAAALLCIGVGLGAFGAHALKASLSTEALQVYQTAVLYHLIHGLGLLGVGLLSLLKPNEPLLRAAGWSLALGILFFSGSLYGLSITGVKKLGMITPFGGLAFLIGWLCLALAAR